MSGPMPACLIWNSYRARCIFWTACKKVLLEAMTCSQKLMIFYPRPNAVILLTAVLTKCIQPMAADKAAADKRLPQQDS